MTKDTATRLHELVLTATAAIDEAVAVAQADPSFTEFPEFRLGAAYALDALMEGLRKPIYRKHPDLITPSLRGHLRL